MSYLALPASFEYLCYGSTAFQSIFTLSVSKVGPRTEKVKIDKILNSAAACVLF